MAHEHNCSCGHDHDHDHEHDGQMDKYHEAFSKFDPAGTEEIVGKHVNSILENHEKENFTPEVLKQIHGCIDLTSLTSIDTKESIWKLADKVNDFEGTRPDVPNVAAICTYPIFVETVNWLTTIISPPDSITERFITPFSSSKMRRLVIFLHSHSISSCVSRSSIPTRTSIPFPILDLTSPSIVTEQCCTRCITVLICMFTLNHLLMYLFWLLRLIPSIPRSWPRVSFSHSYSGAEAILLSFLRSL